MHRILEILEKNNGLTSEQIAVMLNLEATDVQAAIDQFIEEGVIIGKKTVINWQKTKRDMVTAFIELRVTPHVGKGFDQIAERIYNYEQVKSVYLMSGSFDLALIIEGKTLTEVALFVAEKLAPMDSVLSTATHFVLKKYKEDGLMFVHKTKDQREMITL